MHSEFRPGGLDLSDLAEWPDEEVVGALNDIKEGLRAGQIKWIGILDEAFTENDKLSKRQREVGVGILREWNGS